MLINLQHPVDEYQCRLTHTIYRVSQGQKATFTALLHVLICPLTLRHPVDAMNAHTHTGCLKVKRNFNALLHVLI